MTEVAEVEARIQLEPSWKARVGDWLLRPEMQELSAFLRQRKAAGARVFPPGPQIFAAFDATPFEQVKVVILGQDPYHGEGQAHGLCFSVLPGVPVPPSLLNIYKEIQDDLGIARPDHGYLMPWARQGVLLLNAVLTVEQGRAGAHQNKGWEGFTDHVVETSTASAKAWCSCSGAATRSPRARSSTRRAIACSRPRIPRRCRRIAAFWAASTSPRPTSTYSAAGWARSTGHCRPATRWTPLRPAAERCRRRPFRGVFVTVCAGRRW